MKVRQKYFLLSEELCRTDDLCNQGQPLWIECWRANMSRVPKTESRNGVVEETAWVQVELKQIELLQYYVGKA